jgi:hypothetical protein
MLISRCSSIRTHGDGGLVLGTSFTPQIFVSVQWEWLTLPLALIALSLVVLVSTILKGRRHGTKIWKSSSLATLFGLDVDTRRRLGDLEDQDVLDNLTENVMVALKDSGDHGWCLVEAKTKSAIN